MPPSLELGISDLAILLHFTCDLHNRVIVSPFFRVESHSFVDPSKLVTVFIESAFGLFDCFLDVLSGDKDRDESPSEAFVLKCWAASRNFTVDEENRSFWHTSRLEPFVSASHPNLAIAAGRRTTRKQTSMQPHCRD